MSKFIWYIINLEDSSVEGTNDTDALQASGLLESDTHIVLHKDSGKYVDPMSGECELDVTEFPFGVEGDGGEDDIEGTDEE